MRRPTVGEAVSGAFAALGAAASATTLLQYMNVPPEQAAAALGNWFFQYAPLICLLGGFTFGASVSYMVTRWRCGRDSEAAIEKAVDEARSEMQAAIEDAERRASEAEAVRDEALSQREERAAEMARRERDEAESRESSFAERVRHMPIMSKAALVCLIERGDAGLEVREADYASDELLCELQYAGLASWETTSCGRKWRVTQSGRDLAESHPELLDEARAAYEEIRSEG